MPAALQKEHPEMEFMEIYLKKTRLFSSKLFTVPSTGGFQRKPYSSLVLNILKKKRLISILKNRKMRVENQTKIGD
jgi:hypothetical protein